MSIGWGKDTQNDKYMWMLPGSKKEWSMDSGYDMDESKKHCAEWSKSWKSKL
jgi:hypothetical protein